MKSSLLAISVLFCFTANAQLQEKYFDWRGNETTAPTARFYAEIVRTDSGYIRKDYYINEKKIFMAGKYSDADTRTPDGYFEYYHPNGSLSKTGKYVAGRKNGTWLEFHSNGMIKDSAFFTQGKDMGTSIMWHDNGYIADSTVIHPDGTVTRVGWFDNGAPSYAGIYAVGFKKTGKWKYFHKNGNPSAEEVYENDKFVEGIFYNENGERIAKPERDRDATYSKGGDEGWTKFIYKNIYFPNDYKIANYDTAIVVVTFSVSEEGKVENVEVINPFHPRFDAIAVSAIKGSSTWLPAINHNRRVRFYVRQQVTFTQQ